MKTYVVIYNIDTNKYLDIQNNLVENFRHAERFESERDARTRLRESAHKLDFKYWCTRTFYEL